MLSNIAKWSVMLLAFCMVTGCTMLEERKPEDAVRERGMERWAALIEGKLETAYTFETPEYRELYTVLDFRKTVPGVGVWTKAVIENVECNVEKCSVSARIYVNMKIGLAFEKIETNGLTKENWIQGTNGQWYHVSDH